MLYEVLIHSQCFTYSRLWPAHLEKQSVYAIASIFSLYLVVRSVVLHCAMMHVHGTVWLGLGKVIQKMLRLRQCSINDYVDKTHFSAESVHTSSLLYIPAGAASLN